jgi:hypothetical protein
MSTLTEREQIIETVHKLFIYTDSQQWQKLQEEVFTESVVFDMSSLGGEAKVTTAKSICETWESGFAGIDAVNHLAGNLLVSVKDHEADVFAYATATHYKNSATMGKTREFVGTYDLHFMKTSVGWRIDQFKYNLRFMNGNLELK